MKVVEEQSADPVWEERKSTSLPMGHIQSCATISTRGDDDHEFYVVLMVSTYSLISQTPARQMAIL